MEYITLPGWRASTASITSFSALPPAAQNYVKKLEELVGVTSKSNSDITAGHLLYLHVICDVRTGA